MTLFELIDLVEDLREEANPGEETRRYDLFYVTASSLYDLIDGGRYVQIDTETFRK
jgi:hypothetical protein